MFEPWHLKVKKETKPTRQTLPWLSCYDHKVIPERLWTHFILVRILLQILSGDKKEKTEAQ
jgi:hypothetical protein